MRPILLSTIPAALLATLAASPAWAQRPQRPPQAPPDAPGRDTEPSFDDATVEVAPLPDWSIRREVDQLDSSMRDYSSLVQSLSRASDDLGGEFQRYLADPHNEVLASSVERKMALYAQQVMEDFDHIIADQDLLGANFRDLQRKLVAFSHHLGGQAGEFRVRLDGYRAQASDLERRLVEMSVRITEDPPDDEEALRELRREFAREFRRYRIQTRYVNGYQRRYASYAQLQRNMSTLAGMFVNLHEKFNELIENLEHERQYLHDSVLVQADILRIQQIIRDGIVGSDQAIGNVADKLQELYRSVDSFGQVHERINTDLNRFVESQEALLDVTRRIDAIGTEGGAFGDIGADIERAVRAFYDRRDEPLDGEGLLGVDEPAPVDEEEPAPTDEPPARR